jgi:hypothetical protein
VKERPTSERTASLTLPYPTHNPAILLLSSGGGGFGAGVRWRVGSGGAPRASSPAMRSPVCACVGALGQWPSWAWDCRLRAHGHWGFPYFT